MTIEQALIALIGGMCAVLGWLARELWSAVQKLRQDLSQLEVRISGEYVRYDRLQDALKPIMAALDEIKQAMTHKVDK
jgi:hypothetical protein